MVAAMTGRAAGQAIAARELRCLRCSHYFGRILDRVLHEANGNKSTLPVVRKCPMCGRRTVKLQ
jgi:hypothetical protein